MGPGGGAAGRQEAAEARRVWMEGRGRSAGCGGRTQWGYRAGVGGVVQWKERARLSWAHY